MRSTGCTAGARREGTAPTLKRADRAQLCDAHVDNAAMHPPTPRYRVHSAHSVGRVRAERGTGAQGLAHAAVLMLSVALQACAPLQPKLSIGAIVAMRSRTRDTYSSARVRSALWAGVRVTPAPSVERERLLEQTELGLLSADLDGLIDATAPCELEITCLWEREQMLLALTGQAPSESLEADGPVPLAAPEPTLLDDDLFGEPSP